MTRQLPISKLKLKKDIKTSKPWYETKRNKTKPSGKPVLNAEGHTFIDYILYIHNLFQDIFYRSSNQGFRNESICRLSMKRSSFDSSWSEKVKLANIHTFFCKKIVVVTNFFSFSIFFIVCIIIIVVVIIVYTVVLNSNDL